jgi:NAD(P)-dependent dehydrogenase (short-subunit alcohol dehydrogenase family)
MRLEGKVALISGGARGIGEADARLFAREGARVVIGDVLEKEGRQVEAAINDQGGEAVFLKLDVTREADWARAVDATLQRFGKLNVLVNNAGVSGVQWMGEMSVEVWNKIVGTNAMGCMLGTNAAIPAMREAGGGSIINISSQMGIVGSEFGHPIYTASKGAIRAFTKAIAIHHAKDKIRCNSVHPGPIATPGNESRRRSPEFVQRIQAQVPLGRHGQPEEVASGVLYLASDESKWITGIELAIDGGWLAQ